MVDAVQCNGEIYVRSAFEQSINGFLVFLLPMVILNTKFWLTVLRKIIIRFYWLKRQLFTETCNDS